MVLEPVLALVLSRWWVRVGFQEEWADLVAGVGGGEEQDADTQSTK